MCEKNLKSYKIWYAQVSKVMSDLFENFVDTLKFKILIESSKEKS